MSTTLIWDRITIPDDVAPTIVKFETDILHPYQDSVGVWTEGDGDTILANGQRVTATSPPLTEAQSLALLNRDVAEYGPAINRAITVPLTVIQVVPLYSFVHNLGVNALIGSMIAKMFNGGRSDLAADQLPGWCLGNGKIELGLLRRRYAENLMMQGLSLLQAYTTAWAMTLQQLIPYYNKAFSDAASWGYKPAPVAVPTVAVKPPATRIIPAVHIIAPTPSSAPQLTADQLMEMEQDGALNLPGSS